MNINAYAKLNLFLNVHGKYFNDYHSIESIMTPLHLHDLLNVNLIKDSSDIFITTNDPNIPTNEENILFRCARLFQQHFSIKDGFNIYLEKNIPIKSGLGGESADAAALMHYIINSFNLQPSREDILYLGRLLSWDVPFCYFQKSMYINDKKNIFEEIKINKQRFILLVKPEYGISTREAFIELDKHDCVLKDSVPLLKALIEGEHNIGSYLHNCFIESQSLLKKELINLTEVNKELGFDGVSMTGTGSCFFLVTSNNRVLLNGYEKLKDKFPFVYATAINL